MGLCNDLVTPVSGASSSIVDRVYELLFSQFGVMLPQSHINNMSDDYLTNSNLSSESNKLFENESNSEMDTTTSTLYKPKRPKFIRIVPCQVCGDDANDHEHYGGIACYACKVMMCRAFSSFSKD